MMSCPGRGPTDDIIINFSAWDGMGWMLHTATQRSAAQDANAGLKPSEANKAKRGYREPTAASNQSNKQASKQATLRKPYDLLPHD